MNLFFWKNNKTIDSIANNLADELYSHVQPDQIRKLFEGVSDKKELKKSQKILSRELRGIIKKINETTFIHSLGVYGKARLHLKFKLRLEELGYDKTIVDKINETLMVETPHL